MYELFPKAFRDGFGVPILYTSILNALPKTTAIAETLPNFSENVVSSSSKVPVIESLSALYPIMEEELLTLVDSPAPSSIVEVIDLTKTIDDVSLITTHTCSTCARHFIKSKSHRGTRCWTCKKNQSLSADTISFPAENGMLT